MTIVEIPALAEGRLQVNKGDAIHLIGHDELFEGIIRDVEDSLVVIGLGEAFQYRQEDIFDVKFVIDRQVIRRMHLAVEHGSRCDHIFFPSRWTASKRTDQTGARRRQVQTVLEDVRLATNGPQLEAVTAIALRPSGSASYIIFGP